MKESAQAIKQFPSYQLNSTITVEMHGGPMNDKLTMPSSIAVRRPGKVRIESSSDAGSILIVGTTASTPGSIFPNVKEIREKRDAIESPEAAIINALSVLPQKIFPM